MSSMVESSALDDFLVFEEEFDEATKKELEIFHKQMVETEGFGVTYRPKAMGFGGVYPMDLDKCTDKVVSNIIECARFAVDDYNKKQKDGELVFSRILKVTRGAAAGAIYYITFEAMNLSSTKKEIYESKVFVGFFGKKVLIFRLKSF